MKQPPKLPAGEDDLLRAENELLKLKLELNHGMHGMTSELSPEIENQWLQTIFNFEEKYKDVKRIKIFDYVGQPSFKPWNTLTGEEITEELEKLNARMEENNVALGMLCDYGDLTIYRFITEEFFNEEIDDIRIEGMVQNFIYEDYHPNIEYEARKACNEFALSVFEREWNSEFDLFNLAANIEVHESIHAQSVISSAIIALQKRKVRMERFTIKNISIAIERTSAVVEADISYWVKDPMDEWKGIEGGCEFGVESDEQGRDWVINRIQIPGFSL